MSYKPAVGSTAAGQVLLGVDYDPADATLTYNSTAALSPKAVCPVWRETSLSIPPGRAMKQKWLYTDASGSRASATEGSDFHFDLRPETAAFGLQVTSTYQSGSPGSLWVEYNLEFCSPRQPMKIANAAVLTQPNGSEPNNATTTLNLTLASPTANLLLGSSGIQYVLMTGKPNPGRMAQLLATGVRVVSNKRVAEMGWNVNPGALPPNNPGSAVFDPWLVTLQSSEDTPAALFTNVPPLAVSSTQRLTWMMLSALNTRVLRRFVEGGVKTWNV